MPTRRTFLAASALAAAADLPSPAAPENSPFDRPMRWAQLTLTEDDPGQFDPAFWLDYFRRTHSDAACLSAGGCVAYYPTKIPLHYRSQWLGGRDPFGDLVAGCRKLGMTVIARTDPHAAHQDVYDAHPDWIAVEADGKPRRHWAMPELWVTCALGPYNFEFMTEVTKEIVSLYPVDGIFSNRWAGSGMCYCEHCRANFRAARGLDLPRLHRMARAPPLRPVPPLGLRNSQDPPRRPLHPQCRRRRALRSRHEDTGRVLLHPLRRPPGAQRPRAPLGQRQKRQGISFYHGLEARRRHLQRRHRGALSLEGFRAKRRRNPPMGDRRHRPRPPSLVHQIQRHPAGPPLARPGRAALHLARPQRALPPQHRVPRPRGARLLPADRLLVRRKRCAPQGRGPRLGLLPGARRGPYSLRHGA